MNIPDEIVETRVFLKDQFLDLQGLSAYSSLCVSTIRDHIKKNRLPAFTVGGKILIKRSEFDDWMNRFRLNRRKDPDAIANEVVGSLQAEKSDT
jgi:excisionase family DNA binding protein